MVELICDLEERCDIEFGEPEGLSTVGQLVSTTSIPLVGAAVWIRVLPNFSASSIPLSKEPWPALLTAGLPEPFRRPAGLASSRAAGRVLPGSKSRCALLAPWDGQSYRSECHAHGPSGARSGRYAREASRRCRDDRRGKSRHVSSNSWKDVGAKVVPVVAQAAMAVRMERCGADAVIAEGDGGGRPYRRDLPPWRLCRRCATRSPSR